MQKDFEIKLKNDKGISSLGTELNANELKNINGGDDFLKPSLMEINPKDIV